MVLSKNKCLEDRRVVFLGDSLSIQQAYSLVGMLAWHPYWMESTNPYNGGKVRTRLLECTQENTPTLAHLISPHELDVISWLYCAPETVETVDLPVKTRDSRDRHASSYNGALESWNRSIVESCTAILDAERTDLVFFVVGRLDLQHGGLPPFTAETEIQRAEFRSVSWLLVGSNVFRAWQHEKQASG